MRAQAKRHPDPARPAIPAAHTRPARRTPLRARPAIRRSAGRDAPRRTDPHPPALCRRRAAAADSPLRAGVVAAATGQALGEGPADQIPSQPAHGSRSWSDRPPGPQLTSSQTLAK